MLRLGQIVSLARGALSVLRLLAEPLFPFLLCDLNLLPEPSAVSRQAYWLIYGLKPKKIS